MASMESAVSAINRETRMTNSVKDGRVLTVVVIKFYAFAFSVSVFKLNPKFHFCPLLAQRKNLPRRTQRAQRINNTREKLSVLCALCGEKDSLVCPNQNSPMSA
jgi:hypothetical protein